MNCPSFLQLSDYGGYGEKISRDQIHIFKNIRELVPTEYIIYWSVLLTKYYSGNQIKKNEMLGACSKYGVRWGTYKVLVGKHEEKKNLEDPGIDERIILSWIFRK
jgi:hypothetical protein